MTLMPSQPDRPKSDRPRRFQFLLTSARRDGNAEKLARHAAASLPAETDQRWLDLSEFALPQFEDRRHEPGFHYGEVFGNERLLLDATLAATDLVLVVPLYWYSVPASAKLYLDYWSSWLRVPGADFKSRMSSKTLWGVSAFSDEDAARMEPLVGTLRLTADYLGMGWGGVLLGRGNRPGDVMADEAALSAARTFFGGRRAAADEQRSELILT
jgi:putative NADPH-quinone reductase